MKGKHLHAFCLFVCVGRLLFSILMFPGPDSILNIHFVLLRVQRSVINGVTGAVLFSSSSQSLITSNYSLSPSFLHANPKSKGAAHFLQGRGSRASWMKFSLLLGQLANFMFPTECHSVLSKAWFCELTSDRHFLHLTCQLCSGLPHLQHVACKHRPSRPSQEESQGALHLPAPFCSSCLPDIFFCAWAHSVCKCLSVVWGTQRNQPYARVVNPRKGKSQAWSHGIVMEKSWLPRNFLQGYKPALLTAPAPAYKERHSVVSSDWVNAWKSAFVAHVFQKFQNITVSRLYQDHTWVYLPSFQDFTWKEITRICGGFQTCIFTTAKWNTKIPNVSSFILGLEVTHFWFSSKSDGSSLSFIARNKPGWAGLGVGTTWGLPRKTTALPYGPHRGRDGGLGL